MDTVCIALDKHNSDVAMCEFVLLMLQFVSVWGGFSLSNWVFFKITVRRCSTWRNWVKLQDLTSFHSFYGKLSANWMWKMDAFLSLVLCEVEPLGVAMKEIAFLLTQWATSFTRTDPKAKLTIKTLFLCRSQTRLTTRTSHIPWWSGQESWASPWQCRKHQLLPHGEARAATESTVTTSCKHRRLIGPLLAPSTAKHRARKSQPKVCFSWITLSNLSLEC